MCFELYGCCFVTVVVVHEEDDIGLAPIHHAARFGHANCVELLISRGNEKPSRRSLQRLTPIHFAAQNGHNNVIDVLLKYGANVNETDHDSWTALHHAAYQGRGETVSFLLSRSADFTLKNQMYCTPLHVACTG